MAGKTIKPGSVDRWSANAVTNVGKNTPEQQRIVNEINARNTARKTGSKAATKKK